MKIDKDERFLQEIERQNRAYAKKHLDIVTNRRLENSEFISLCFIPKCKDRLAVAMSKLKTNFVKDNIAYSELLESLMKDYTAYYALCSKIQQDINKLGNILGDAPELRNSIELETLLHELTEGALLFLQPEA